MGKLTINDIAKIAGVSKATVSRTLSNPELVKESTRNRIMEVVKSNGFVPNTLAQGLAGGSTETIGVIVDELFNDFYIELVEGVDNIISGYGYSLQLSSSHWDEDREYKAVCSMISRRMDGIVLAPLYPDSRAIKVLKDSGIPFVVVNCTPDDTSIPYVTFDNFSGAKLVAEHINEIDPEEESQLILITGFSHQTVDDRISGFMSALKNPGRVIHYEKVRTLEDGKDFARVLISRNNLKTQKTILFITNDNVALGILSSLISLGVDVPGTVQIIGFDDIKNSSIAKVALSTVSQSIVDIGKLAAMDLVDMIHGKELAVSHHVIEPILRIRESSR